MTATPHALFELDASGVTDKSQPPGRDLAVALAHSCAAGGFSCSRVELWRDVGWFFRAESGSQAYDVYFARYKDAETLLAVAPLDPRGLWARMFGLKREISIDQLKGVCGTIHGTLAAAARVRRIRWMVGGPPERVRQFETPESMPLRSGV